jgi:hypothetical protein
MLFSHKIQRASTDIREIIKDVLPLGIPIAANPAEKNNTKKNKSTARGSTYFAIVPVTTAILLKKRPKPIKDSLISLNVFFISDKAEAISENMPFSFAFALTASGKKEAEFIINNAIIILDIFMHFYKTV